MQHSVMDLTTADIAQAIDMAERYYSQPAVRRQLLADKAKQKEEEDKLKKELVCHMSDLDKIRDRLGSLDTAKFRQILTKYFFDGAMMKVAFCILESIIADQGKLADGGLTENQRVRHWIRADKQIGSESVFGYAMSTSFDDSEALLVAKAPRPNVGAGDSIHEYVIGALALNNLRQYIPNFAYVFGTFDCASPVIGANKEIDTWCGYQPGVNYVIYENVNPAVPLGNLNKNITFDRFLNYYLQTLLALRLAREKYDFTHYDLHDQNVLIRKLPQRVSIDYNTPEGQRYVVTDAIATIIDYGQSHAKINGVSVGYYGLEAYGNLPTHAFPLFDAYKLLLMSMRTMMHADNHAFHGAATLLRFFTPEDPVSVVKQQSKFYYVLPRTKKVLKYGLDDFLKYIIKLYPTALSEKPNVPLLKCAAEQCKNPRASLKWLDLSKEPEASDLLSLYDLSKKFQQEGNIKEEEKLLKSYPYQQDIGKTLSNITYNLDEMEKRLNNFRPIPLSGENLPAYRQQFDKFAEMVDLLEDLGLGLEALEELSSEYADDKTHAYLMKLEPRYLVIRDDLLQLNNKYLEDATTILEIEARRQAGRRGASLPTKPKVPWLFDIFPGQVQVVSKTLDNSRV